LRPALSPGATDCHTLQGPPLACERWAFVLRTAVAGDLAPAHGSNAVVISSGLSKRMASHLKSRLFVGRFVAKGRYRHRMEAMPVRLVLHDQPGLLGAAVAFQHQQAS